MTTSRTVDTTARMGSTSHRSRTWLAAGAGFVVGAGAAVALLLGLGWSPHGAQDGSQDEEPITLPETAAGLRVEAVVVEELRGEPIAGRQEALEETAELLAASRDGAASAVQAYADDDLDERVTIWVVADESPGLWSDQESEALAELLGLAAPMEWLERDDDVECLAQPAEVMVRDGEVEPRLTHCQLVQEGMTLILTGPGHDTVGRPAEILRDVAANVQRG